MTHLLALAALLSATTAPVPDWPFPGLGVAVDPTSSTAPEVVRLAGSAVVFHQSDLDNMTRAIDWFPDAHPPAPEVVMQTRSEAAVACGYCHLADGRGRPENASLQGLPADYIVEQVKAFASGARRAASPAYAPTRYMAAVAHAISPADLDAAATYFSQFEPQSHTQIIETARIPEAAAWHFVYRFDASRKETLDQRILEGPDDRQRFALRDPETSYTAYVPVGAIGRGQVITKKGASGSAACVSCHGQALAGIAGASPTYLVRQLMGFRDKTRNDPSAAPMQAVAKRMTDAQIIDVAAFVASRRAWRHSDVP